ncbi:hypothetical protein [Winogradskyella sp.]|uniref:hypothetical protein n=1 Tax=Winogradskyella sp. TaxID=1883156 RepID=UPI003AB8D274
MEIDKAINSDNAFKLAKQFLVKKGSLTTTEITKENKIYYRVKVTVDDTEYYEENLDSKLATIRLRNQFN